MAKKKIEEKTEKKVEVKTKKPVKKEEKNFSKQNVDFAKLNSKIQGAVNNVLNKKGLDSIEFLSDNIGVNDYISTGNLAFNYAISGKIDGGYPVGRITELSGDPSAGKSFLSTVAAINSLKKQYVTYFFDSEMAYDENFAKLIARVSGEDPSIVNLINYNNIDSIEETMSKIISIIDVFEKNKINSGATIIVDGIAFLTTSKEKQDIDSGKEKVDMTKAKILRQFLRVIKNRIKPLNICMIFTNQLTHNIGVSFGEKKVTTGGTAVPFASSVRTEISSKKILADKKLEYTFQGLTFNIRTKKTRLTTPYKKATFSFYIDGQIEKIGNLVDLLFYNRVFDKEKNSYIFDDVRFTKKNFEEVILKNPEQLKKLKERIAEYEKEPPKINVQETIEEPTEGMLEE